jgi:L-rhamnose mutarotase
MQRHAFKMKLKRGFEAEYERRHDLIWPELAAELAKAGVRDYSIFLDEETLTLFAVQRLTDGNAAAELPASPIVKKWWAYMKDIMETNSDNSPVSRPLKEVFHID